MRRRWPKLFYAATLAAALSPTIARGQPASSYAVAPAVAPVVQTFPLDEVRVLGGPLRQAQDTDLAYLLRLNPDALLHYMRQVAGLQPKADHYGGWEKGCAGMIGHYLSAISMMYAATGDPELKRRVNYIVSEMAACQAADGDGSLHSHPNDAKNYFPALARGEVHRSPVNGWYVEHKTFAGLRDAYLYTGSPQAKACLIKLADYYLGVTKNLKHDDWQSMLDGEHGGPHEIFADVYAITGDRKYLDEAEKFKHELIFNPLLKGDDTILFGKHANTQIPKFIGYERIYELSGEPDWHAAAANFWRLVVSRHTWVTGGNSQWETFFNPDDFLNQMDERCGPETCNTYNMLKLTRQLYQLDPSVKYVDYYERALYNSILSSQDHLTGGMVYYTPMRPGHYRVFSDDFDSFWCCVGTGMENHAKYGELIYAHDADELFVNLFVDSHLDWRERGLIVRMETAFPESDEVKLTIHTASPQELTLKVRYPSWVETGALKAEVNGQGVAIDGTPGQYVSIRRTWNDNDTVNLRVPRRLTTEFLPGNSEYVAVLDGPIVLAGELGTEGLTGADFHKGNEGRSQLATRVISMTRVPMLAGDPSSVASKIKPVAGQSLTFTTEGLSTPVAVRLVPFYTIRDERYAIYWRTGDPQKLADDIAKERATEQAMLELEQNTVDQVRVGEQQPETDHQMQAQNSRTGTSPPPYSHWRDSTNEFSYELAVEPNTALRCVYWGSDDGRVFEILVDGKVIATQKLNRSRPSKFLDVTYPLPKELVARAKSVRVTFRAKPGSIAGGVFDVRILRQKS